MIQVKPGDTWPEDCPPGEFAVISILLDDGWGTPTILAFQRSIAAADKEAYQQASVNFGLVTKESALLLVMQFCLANESVRVFNSGFDARESRILPIPLEKYVVDGKFTIELVVIESSSSEVVAVRKLSLDAAFTDVFFSAVRDQLKSQNDPTPHYNYWFSGGLEDISPASIQRFEAQDRTDSC